MTPIPQFQYLISAILVHLPVPTPHLLSSIPPFWKLLLFFIFIVIFYFYIGMHKSLLFELDKWLHLR